MPVSEIDRHLGLRIANARQASGLERQQLAAQIEIETDALAQIEMGEMRVSALVLARISRVLKTPLSWFYTGLPGQQVFDAGPDNRRLV